MADKQVMVDELFDLANGGMVFESVGGVRVYVTKRVPRRCLEHPHEETWPCAACVAHEISLLAPRAYDPTYIDMLTERLRTWLVLREHVLPRRRHKD